MKHIKLIKFNPLLIPDILSIDFRDKDLLEVRALTGVVDIQDQMCKIIESLHISNHAWVGYYDNRPCGVFGYTEDVAIMPWMLSDGSVMQSLETLKELMLLSRRFIKMLDSKCKYMHNYVAVDNKMSQTYIRKLGFVIDDEVLQMNGVKLQHFYRS